MDGQPPKMDVDTLLALWRGDDASTGYQHAGLVAAVCAKTTPANFSECRLLFYPGVPLDDHDELTLEILRAGYALWERRLALPRR